MRYHEKKETTVEKEKDADDTKIPKDDDDELED